MSAPVTLLQEGGHLQVAVLLSARPERGPAAAVLDHFVIVSLQSTAAFPTCTGHSSPFDGGSTMPRTRLFVLGAVAFLTAALAACGADPQPRVPAAAPTPVSPAGGTGAAAADPVASATPARRAPARGTSDLAALERAGIDLGVTVLIDVADDGVDKFLEVGTDRVVDFTGHARTPSTMMSLWAAPVLAENHVVIKPSYWNTKPGDDNCVADTLAKPLVLETCEPGKASQIWRVSLAGDSGQFELHGAYGVIRVQDGAINSADGGRTGLQTVPFRK
ncbi:hypothetical protein O7635_23080 [Asanoa sp. WMMD1127]|uniref:hypothetical protein n=1 Tax=Asanoa sp. WMMD1127 TaxID=3016107 RepID=UPI002415A7A7|nr:hypothetical protein [Asanoa sp. WMMD1127]MDG4824744.1 hypothetical protein [Asanoa sp. WMMD1127]